MKIVSNLQCQVSGEREPQRGLLPGYHQEINHKFRQFHVGPEGLVIRSADAGVIIPIEELEKFAESIEPRLKLK